MKVILENWSRSLSGSRVWIRYLHLYFRHWVDTSAGEVLVSEDIIRCHCHGLLDIFYSALIM